MIKIYVGNLSSDTTEDHLRDLFAQHGNVQEAYLVNERGTQKPRGFAFVMMPEPSEAKAAVAALNGHEIEGRAIVVSEARTKQEERQKAREASDGPRHRPGSRRGFSARADGQRPRPRRPRY